MSRSGTFLAFARPGLYMVSFTVVGACRPTENGIDVSAATDLYTDTVPTVQDSAAITTVAASIGDWVWDDTDGDGPANGANGIDVTLQSGDFVDSNGNGVQDPGEPDLAGVDLVVTDSNGITQTVTTDATGNYTATVPPGSTTLQVDEQTLPPDYILTTGFPLITINVTDGNISIGPINGYLPPSVIAGYVYADSNGNGVHDVAEPALAGVSVFLSNGMTATTTATGAYSFTVASGTYTVTATDLPHYASTGAEPGTIGSVVLDSSTIAVTVGDGESSQANNFLDIQLAHVWGVIWLDINRDGIKNDGNPSDEQLAGLEVVIYNALTNSLVATTTTNLAGVYDFENLMPSEYFLQFTLPNGFLVTPVHQGGDGTMDSDVDPENDLRTPIVLLLSGDNNLMLDMGIALMPTDLEDGHEPAIALPYRNYLPSVAR